MDIKPITREEMYLAKAAGQDVSPPEPITRKEMFLAKIAGMEVETPGAITRIEMFANKAAVALNRSVIEPLEITENGTYTAPEGVDGYNPVTVEVVGAGGGGSSADVRYVTFMSYDGSVEYGKKAVAVGDDCADPIARGVFDTPTRESTAQYSYTHYGWSLEANGATDANALKAVTEDRTVYATFVSAVRYYTISYYDGETLLKSESLTYGSTPSCTVMKDGYTLVGWEPEFVMVTEDAVYHAQWIEKISFNGSSWAKIAEISESGQAANSFNVGDIKEVTLTNGWKMTVEIVGFNHDDLADGSGKAGISMLFRETDPTLTATTDMLRNGVGTPYIDYIPSEIKEVAKPVIKEIDGSPSPGTDISTVNPTFWLPSAYEVNRTYSDVGYRYETYVCPLGEVYQAFENYSQQSQWIRKDINGNAVIWLTRNYIRAGNKDSVTCDAAGSFKGRERWGSVIIGFCI